MNSIKYNHSLAFPMRNIFRSTSDGTSPSLPRCLFARRESQINRARTAAAATPHGRDSRQRRCSAERPQPLVGFTASRQLYGGYYVDGLRGVSAPESRRRRTDSSRAPFTPNTPARAHQHCRPEVCLFREGLRDSSRNTHGSRCQRTQVSSPVADV